jgi:hypothetical protein
MRTSVSRKRLPEGYIKDNLAIDDDGNLIWITRQRGRKYLSHAGCVTVTGKGISQCRVTILGNWYLKSSIVWFLSYGKQIDDGFVIDHLDGDPTNNHITNLKRKSYQENNKNKRMQANNTSGITGVRSTKNGRFVATIGTDILYRGNDFFEACCARMSAKKQLDYTDRHGKQLSN